MKSFFKYVLATIVGFIIVNLIILFLFIGVIVSVNSVLSPSVNIKNNSILKISFENSIPDKASDNPLENIDIFSLRPVKQIGLNKILENISRAAKDDRIKGIYLDLSDIQSNFGALATIQEIRNALIEFKKSGKFIYSYSNLSYSQKSYYLATVSDSIFVNPQSPLLLTGMSSTVTFYKDLFKKVGLEPEVIRVGKFKAAVEPYIETKMSDSNREQVQTYLNSLWGNIVSGISETRNISPERINELTDNFRIYPAETFVEEGFFDGAIYENEMLDILKKKVITEDNKLNFIGMWEYIRDPKYIPQDHDDKIAVIYAQGNIMFEQSSTSIGPELARIVRRARENNDIKAIVLRVNSPGGSALTSDIIWKEVELAAKEKPLIVSMGNVAASGGYYISCAADTIVADPTTLTGSIGIFGVLFSGEKLYKEKLGLTTDNVKTNEHSDFGGGYPLGIPIGDRPLTAYERNVMQTYINQGYETFLDRVAKGRNMTRDEVNEIAQGRVWTGEDALRIGLVDVLGGLEDAIEIAARKAGLETYQITELPQEKNQYTEILMNLSENIRTSILRNELGSYYDVFNEHKQIIELNGILARVPYHITFDQ